MPSQYEPAHLFRVSNFCGHAEYYEADRMVTSPDTGAVYLYADDPGEPMSVQVATFYPTPGMTVVRMDTALTPENVTATTITTTED